MRLGEEWPRTSRYFQSTAKRRNQLKRNEFKMNNEYTVGKSLRLTSKNSMAVILGLA
jgi:hypothetical protein